jgi:hypothetical protein
VAEYPTAREHGRIRRQPDTREVPPHIPAAPNRQRKIEYGAPAAILKIAN